MKKYLIIIFAVICCCHTVSAQDISYSDVYNNGGLISDFGLTSQVSTSTFTGIGYVSTTGGIFDHFGPANNGAGIGTLHVIGNYDANGGIDNFNGPENAAGTQQITGTIMPAFGILNINNGIAQQFDILNSKGINISSTANFSNGITTTVRSNTNNGSMHFANGAGYTNSLGSGTATFPGTGDALDAQHVDGYVTTAGTGTFVFPVGSSNDYRPLQMSAPATVTDAYAVAWIKGDPSTVTDPSDAPASALHSTLSLGSGIVSVSTVGQWDWMPVSGTGTGLSITVSIPDLGVVPLPAANKLRLVGWNGTQWVDLSGSANASGNTENSTLSGIMIAGITAIGIGSVDALLPVTLKSFTGTGSDCSAVLHWNTGTEINLNHFEIEYSADGMGFAKVGNVPGKNIPSGAAYDLRYAQPEGEGYYRLRIVDEDGNAKYSNVVAVKTNCGHAIDWVIAPNPVQSGKNLTIKFTNADASIKNISISVIDMLGQRSFTGIFTVSSGINSCSMNSNTLAKGTYIIVIKNSKNNIPLGKAQKMIIE